MPSLKTAPSLIASFTDVCSRGLRRSLLVAGAFFLAITASFAQADARWSSTNLQYHYGTDYELGDEERTLITLENEVTFGTDLGQQITLAWGMPFAIGKAKFSFEGFFDYAWDVGPSEDNIVTQPRLLLDVGSLFDSPGVFQAGIEYQIWKNKFGIDGVDESFPELMVKWIF